MKQWYVVQVYAGHEESIKSDLLRRIKEAEAEDLFGEIFIPSAKLRKVAGGMVDAQDQHQQLFPGYVLVEMQMLPETMRLVLANSRVLRFLGGVEPVPLSAKEISQIISQSRGEITVGVDQDRFSAGAEVDIIEGPFAGFVGVVESVDVEHERLVVMVNILGRMMPVELGFNQVK